MEVQDISFIIRSKNRFKVLSFMKDEKVTPRQIMKSTNMYESHVSRTLKELKQKKLIVCLNPEDRKYKFYKITRYGIKILEECKKIK